MREAPLTLLAAAAAAEKSGLGRMLKANTAKKRTHSLCRQGAYGYSAIPAMRVERLRELMAAFAEVIAPHEIFTGLFGVIRVDVSGFRSLARTLAQELHGRCSPSTARRVPHSSLRRSTTPWGRSATFGQRAPRASTAKLVGVERLCASRKAFLAAGLRWEAGA